MPEGSADVREALFVLLRAAMDREKDGDDAFEGLPPDGWRELYALAARQGVAETAWDGLGKLESARSLAPEGALLRELRIRWGVNVAQTERRYERQRGVLLRLLAFYGRTGFRTMLLKGLGLSLYYPVPSHRPCGDIDVWLFGRGREADERMRKERGVDIDTGRRHHSTFAVDGVTVENHSEFLNVFTHASNRTLEKELRELALRPGPAFRPAEMVEISADASLRRRCETTGPAQAQSTVGEPAEVGPGSPEAEASLPPPDFNALFLLRHAAGHFAAERIGVRHVLDWMLFVEHNRTAIDWKRVVTTARKLNMHRFLGCLNAIAIDMLGMDATAVPPFVRDAALERRVLNDLLAPEFDAPAPEGRLPQMLHYKLRRWWANRWKHRIVYREGLAATFLRQVGIHLLEPRSLRY